SYGGSIVLHGETFPILRNSEVSISVKDFNHPEDQGTLIVPYAKKGCLKESAIVGIAGKTDFTVITVKKSAMNKEIGFVQRILTILEENLISFDHIPSNIDAVSLVIDSRQFALTRVSVQDLLESVQHEC